MDAHLIKKMEGHKMETPTTGDRLVSPSVKDVTHVTIAKEGMVAFKIKSVIYMQEFGNVNENQRFISLM